MSAPAIRCEGLCRWYGEVQGLSGISLEIGTGVAGLLGPNGSGKSTFMRLLTGLIRPNRGWVEVFGQRMDRAGRHEVFRRVGYAVGEDVHFESERAVDFLRLLAMLGGASAAQARDLADRALERVALADRAATKLSGMSKGMRQRIKVAQSLLFEPELLLLDEPLNGMDPVSRRSTLDLVRAWGASGRTVVFASHVLHEVEAVTERVVLLHHGRLLAEGLLAEIRELVDERPRRVRLEGDGLATMAAAALAAGIASGVTTHPSGGVLLETRQLPALMLRLLEAGAGGAIHSLEVDDADLETLFTLLLEEST
jgi:ABC-2 type transport system ATP-binding protein